MKRGRAAMAAVAAFTLAVPTAAWAFPEALGPRATAMGEAGVADARATDALRLNPAAMSLAALYTVAADYQFLNKQGGQSLNAGVADSTSDYKIGGGLFYGYRSASPTGLPSLAAHQAGVALSYSISERLLLGGTVKYVHVSGGLEPDGRTDHGGVTADAGLVLRVAPGVALGAAGYNLHDLSTVEAPLALGYGIAFSAGSNVTLVADALHDFTTSDPTRGTRTNVGGGGELLLKNIVAVRLGGGHDGGARGPAAAYVTGGLAALSELGAFDASVRQDLSGPGKITTVIVGVRLFVQAPQPASSNSFLPSPSTTDGSSGLPFSPSAAPPAVQPASPSSAPELH
jgi:hypothetical protein